MLNNQARLGHAGKHLALGHLYLAFHGAKYFPVWPSHSTYYCSEDKVLFSQVLKSSVSFYVTPLKHREIHFITMVFVSQWKVSYYILTTKYKKLKSFFFLQEIT